VDHVIPACKAEYRCRAYRKSNIILRSKMQGQKYIQCFWQSFLCLTSHDPDGYSSSGPPDPFSFSSSCLPVAEHDSCTSTLKAKTASREGHQDIQASVAEETYDSTNTFHPWHGIQQVLTPPETSANKLPNKLLPLTGCQR
jgi:hypothetical protein